jgi:hypothetical protein
MSMRFREGLHFGANRFKEFRAIDFPFPSVKKLEGGGYEVRMHESTKQLQVLSCHAS